MPRLAGRLTRDASLDVARGACIYCPIEPFRRLNALALPDDLHLSIQSHCAEGDALADDGRYGDAIATYRKAWDLLPEPKTEWSAATWLLAAIGDAAFLDGDTETAHEHFRRVMTCPGAVGNPWLHLRLGQTCLDLGRHDRAADELMRAWMGAGADVFELDDDRYLDFLRTRANLDV